MSARLLLCALATSTVFSAAALAADPPPPPHNFDEMKAHHLDRLEKELACVQAATNFEQMHACMPPPGGHRGPPPPN